MKNEQNEINKSEADENLLIDLQNKVNILEKELLLKKLELRLHKNHRYIKDERRTTEIDFDHYYEESPLEWKERFSKWRSHISLEKVQKQEENETKEFIPYKRDFLLRFVYDTVGKKIGYPFNCFFISLILLPLVILPFYFILGPESLYTTDETIGILESTTFMMVVILIPAALIILKKIFDNYNQTFKDLRNVAKVTNNEYQEFISLSNWTLQSPSVKYFWIGSWIIIIIFGFYFYNNPKPTDLIDDVGLLGLFAMILTYIITSTIVISLSWYLLSIVRIIRRFTLMPLDIRPLDPDGAAGLKPLSALSFNLSLVSLLGVAGLIFGLFFGGRSIEEPTTVFFLISLILLMIILFLLPLSNAHNVMDEEKSDILKILSAEHALAYQKIREEIPKTGPSVTSDSLTELQGIAELYDRANNMPVWPFDFHTLSNLIAAIILPLVLIFLEDFFFA